MRIGIITPGYSRDEQDWAIPVLRHLVRALAQQHEVMIFTLRHPNVRESYFVDGVKVIALGGGVVGGFGRFPLYLRTIHAIHKHAPFDILHGFWADEPSAIAVLAGKLLRVPVVASVFGGELVNLPDISYGGARSRINRLLSRFALKYADVVTAGSDYVAEIAREILPSATVVRWSQGVMYNGLSSPLRERTGKSVVHVGALSPVKDQETLLRAFAEIVREVPDARLTIAGEGPMRARLEGLAAEFALTDKVTFLGHVAHAEMAEVYRSADLLLLTSRHESQAMVLLEAIANGCPVIGTRVGLIPELVPSALSAESQDATTLANAAISLLQNMELRQSLLGNQTKQLVEQFTLDKAVEQICTIYNSCTG